MYNVKLYNKISKVGLDDLDAAKYTCSEDFTDYDAVLVRSAKLHEVEFSKNLKCIARAGAGVNNIPIDRCSQEGIVVFNTPGANANAVKELVICALLLASRKVVQGANWVKGLKGTPDIGPAAEKGKATYAGPEIAGKKLGIIGLGAIGVKVANAAVALDMEVWGYDPFLSVDGALKLDRSVKHVTDLNEIFANCDYITIHVPLNADTKNTISAEAIEKMKDGVRVINLARGELVDTKAMAKALESGKVAAYVSDVVPFRKQKRAYPTLLPTRSSSRRMPSRCRTSALPPRRARTTARRWPFTRSPSTSRRAPSAIRSTSRTSRFRMRAATASASSTRTSRT